MTLAMRMGVGGNKCVSGSDEKYGHLPIMWGRGKV